MADDVSVQFGAQLGNLLGGLKQATDGVKSFVDQSKTAVAGLTAPFEKLQSTLLAVAAIAAGGAIFKDIISSTVDATSETLKLSKTFGLSLNEASALRVQLTTLGISTDDYSAMALRMDRQLKQNETSLKAMGLTTRDASGQLLSQQALLQSGVDWLRQFKEGSDRNIASQALFGRNVGEVGKLLKMTGETAARARKDLQDLGLVTTPEDVARAREYKIAMNELGLSFEAIKKSIGDAVLPYLTKFAEWFRQNTPYILSTMKDAVKSIIIFSMDLISGLVNFSITLLEILGRVGNAFDNLSSRASSAASGALKGMGAGSALGPPGAAAGAILGAGAGWFNGADKANNEKFAESQRRFEEIRQSFQQSMDKFREMVLSGGPELGPAPEKAASGSKSAAGLIGMQDQVKAQKLAIDEQIKLLQAGLAMKTTIFNAEVENFQLTQNQKFALLQQETAKEYQAELALLEKQKAIGGQTVAQRQEVENKIKELKSKNNAAMVQLDLQAIAAAKQQWQTYLDALGSSFNANLRGLLAGTTSFKQAFKTILGDMIIFFIEQIEKMGLQWLATQLGMTTATTTGAAARATAEASASTAGSTKSYAEGVAQVMRSAVQTFAGVFANLSPVMGPAAAAPAAASQAVVAASVAEMPPPFEQGAFQIPGTMKALLHKDEMVLPAAFAQSVRNMVTGASGSRDGGDVIIHALDGASVEALFMRNGKALVRSIKKQARQGGVG